MQIDYNKKYYLKEFLKIIKNIEGWYELINGKICLMPSNTITHQRIKGFILFEVGNYLEGKSCGEVLMSPLDVVLFKKCKKKSQNVFQPDVFVVCDPKKISKKRIYGAPDLVFEIVDEATTENDYIYKFNMYMQYGVKEYWIVNPMTKQIMVYKKDKKGLKVYNYSFSDKIKVGIFDDFEIDFKELQI